jgi:hypothetical protein
MKVDEAVKILNENKTNKKYSKEEAKLVLEFLEKIAEYKVKKYLKN